jgi:nucleoside-diphosphate-sugar epimerase
VRHTSDLASLKGLPVNLYVGDVREPGTLDLPTQDVDYIFHLAAELMVASEEAFEATNTRGTENLLKAAEKNAAGTLKRFLIASSQAAVGPGTDPTPVEETAEARPISWYGVSKKKVEQLAHDWAGRLPITIVRPPAVYGEREKDLSRTYPIVASRLQPKLGFQKKHLSMVYAGDLARGMAMAAESEAAKGRTYFLAHPDVLTDVAVTRTTGEAMGKRFGIPLPTPHALLRLAAPLAELAYHFTGDRPPITRDKVREVSQRYWVADPSKAREDFGWEAQYSFLEGMKKTLPYFFAERAKVHALEGQGGVLLWVKYLVVATLLGAVIESTSNIGQFYVFTPPWAVIPVVLGMFGVGLGTTAMVLRRQSGLLQFIVGTALATAVEIINQFKVIPGFFWEFAPGWPFGIMNPWVRSVVLSLAAGVVVLLVNAIMRHFYRRRLRLG